MKIKTLFLGFFIVGVLTACESGKVSDLESKVQELQAELKKANDPSAVAQLHRELIKQQRAHIRKKRAEKTQLWDKISKTTTKAACEEAKTKYFEIENEIKDLISEYQISITLPGQSKCWTCSNEGLIFGNRDENGVCGFDA